MIEPFIIGEPLKLLMVHSNDFVGDIKEVNEEKRKKIIVKIFDEGTEVRIEFLCKLKNELIMGKRKLKVL